MNQPQNQNNPFITQQNPDLNQNIQKSKIFVSVRIRPLNEKESDFSKLECLTIQGNTINITDQNKKNSPSKEQQFTYDYVFNKDSSQEEVYNNTTKNLLKGIINGYNATVIAYGATGSGKTYTMLGTDNEPGIMKRAIIDLFQIINKKDYKIKISYLEIYNEIVRDLLGDGNNLNIYNDPKNDRPFIKNLKEIEINDTNSFFKYLLDGNNKRAIGETSQNEKSSRSHAVLQIFLSKKEKKNDNISEIITSKFCLVDLAGSEGLSKSINTLDNKTKIEGSKINRSLLAFGNCINAIVAKKNINWRDSKLTRILEDSLKGNSKTVMICTVSPSTYATTETINTLVYANRAKNIQTTIKKNTVNVIDMDYHLNKYDEVISNLTNELQGLRNQLAVQTNNQHLLNLRANENNEKDARIDKLSKEIGNHFQEELRLKNEIIDMEKNIDNLTESIKVKEYNLFKVINSNPNRTNTMKEKEIRAQINRISEQINIQKNILFNKENKYNELFKKREYFENIISKFGNNQNGTLSTLQYLYNSYVFEINNLSNEFTRKRNLNLIRQKDLKIQKLLEQLKIRDEYISNEKKELQKKKVNFYFEGEKNIKRVEDLNVEKSQALPIIQQVVSGSRTPLQKTNNNSRVTSANLSKTGGKFDYSGYSNPHIVKEKQVFKTKTNEIMNKSRKNELTELKLNMLNDRYKNSKVRYVNKRHIKFSDDIEKNDNNNDESIVIAFDTRNLNKSHSNASFYSKRSQSDMSKSRINFNFKEREMENKVKRILVGKKKTSPYVNK